MPGEPSYDDVANKNASKRTLRLSARDLKAARRLLTLLVHGGNSIDTNLTRPAPTEPSPDPSFAGRLARAREEFENRRRRKKFFRSSLFGEPAWDMLLALYILDAAGPRQTAGALLQFSGASRSSGKRWLATLIGYGLVRREDHPNDARTYYVGLTDKAREGLDDYFSELVKTAV